MAKQQETEELTEFEKWQFSEREKSDNHWFNKSSDLHASAGVIWLALDNNENIRRNLGYSKGFSLSVACYPSYKLLVALSIELIIKSIIVAKGKKPKTIHDLNRLSDQAGLKITEEEKVLFQLLSEIIYWEGKYPVPNNPRSLFNQWKLWNTIFTRKIAKTSDVEKYDIDELVEWDNMNKLWGKFAKILFDLKNK